MGIESKKNFFLIEKNKSILIKSLVKIVVVAIVFVVVL